MLMSAISCKQLCGSSGKFVVEGEEQTHKIRAKHVKSENIKPKQKSINLENSLECCEVMHGASLGQVKDIMN